MKEEQNIHHEESATPNENEQELWDLLSDPIMDTPKAGNSAKAQKQDAKFAKSRKIDGFFVTCMVGVAAVSVAATLILSGLLGGVSTPTPSDPAVRDPASETLSQVVTELEQANVTLERENAELRAQLEQQKKQIKDLQTDLLNIMGSEEYLSTVPTDPGETNTEVMDAQLAAYELFGQIQEAYADFDREKLEELIPEMDTQLSYLSEDALSIYYNILEYMEQPSNG